MHLRQDLADSHDRFVDYISGLFGLVAGLIVMSERRRDITTRTV